MRNLATYLHVILTYVVILRRSEKTRRTNEKHSRAQKVGIDLAGSRRPGSPSDPNREKCLAVIAISK